MFLLPGTLTIHNVDEYRQKLITYLEQNKEKEATVLDATALQDIDTAGLQLLLSFCKIFLLEERSFRIINKDPYVQQIFDLSGSSDVLEKVGQSWQ